MQWDDSIAERVEKRVVEEATVPSPEPEPEVPASDEYDYQRQYPDDDEEDPTPREVDRDEALEILSNAFETMSNLLLTLGPEAAMALYHLGVAARMAEKLRG